jgi:hypothetical protein
MFAPPAPPRTPSRRSAKPPPVRRYSSAQFCSPRSWRTTRPRSSAVSRRTRGERRGALRTRPRATPGGARGAGTGVAPVGARSSECAVGLT